jgi:hypothetical protein
MISKLTRAEHSERGADDSVMTPEGVSSIPVVIDLMSLGLMKGTSQLIFGQ